MKRALVFLGLLLAGMPAMADPVSLVSLFTALAVGAGTITVTQAAWIAVAAAIYGTVDARRKARKAQAKARAAYNASLEDRSVTVLSAEAPWLVCYGRAIYGGSVVAILTSDKTGYRKGFGVTYTKPDAIKHIVVVVAAHEVQAINEVYIDGVAVGTLDGSGYATSGEFYSSQDEQHTVRIAAGGNSVQPYAVTVLAAYDTALSEFAGDHSELVDGSYTITGGGLQINNTGANEIEVTYTFQRPLPSVRIQKHLGSASQTADAMLTATLPAEWLSTDRLRGLAYVVVSLDLENQRFLGGPPQMTFDVSGRLVYDPRTATTAWSDNPALCARDYITSEWGMNCLAADVDDTYTNAAANACDALVPLVDFNVAALVSHFATAGAAESWVAGGATATVANGVLTLASSGGDPSLSRTGLSISGTAHRAVRVRFKRNAGSGWDGNVFYSTAGHGFDGAVARKGIAQPTYGADGYAEATWDMSTLDVGGADWISNTITGIRIDLGTTGGDSFDIDWIAVGPLTARCYTCNGVVNSDQAKEAVLQDLAECMGGYITYGAQWSIQAGAWTASVMDLTDDDLMGQIEVVQGGAGMDEVFNSVRGSYIPAGGWTTADLDVYSRASYVTADGGVSLYTDLQLPFTDSKARGKNLAALFVERNRLGQVIRYPAKLRAWPLQVGDRVRVTSTEYGFSTAYYRVTDWQFSLAGAVELTLQQDAAAIYDLPNAPTPNTAATSGLPNPWVVATPSGLAASSDSALADGSFNSRVRVTWTAITDPYLVDGGGFVLVRWYRALYDPPDAWQALAPVPAGEVYALIEGVRVGDALVIEVRFQNALGALSSPAFLVHVVEDNSTGRPSPGATTDLVLVNLANCTVVGNTVTKTSGSGGAWDASVYSQAPIVGGAFVAFIAPTTAGDYMIGLNTDPTTDTSYSSLDYAIRVGAGTYDIWESNVGTTGAAYVAGDAFSITYDGQYVRYYKNASLLKGTPAAPGQTLYLDSSFLSVGGRVESLRFGPFNAVTQGRSNLLPNGGFENGLVGWTQSGPLTLGVYDDAVWGKRALATHAGTTGVNALSAGLIVCQPNAVYTISADAAMFATVGQVYVDLIFYDSGFVLLLDGPQNPIPANVDFAADGTNRNRIAVAVTAPSTAAYMSARVIWDMTTACTVIGVREVKVERGDLPPTPYDRNNGLVDTLQITDGAATGVQQTAVSSVSITQNSHVPDGISFQTACATLTFTPSSVLGAVAVDVLVIATFSWSFANASGSAGQGAWGLQNAAAFDGFNMQWTPLVANGATELGSTTVSKRFSATANASLTVGLYGKRLSSGDTFTITNLDLRAEVIKK